LVALAVDEPPLDVALAPQAASTMQGRVNAACRSADRMNIIYASSS